MNYLSNAFSLNMVSELSELHDKLRISHVGENMAKAWVNKYNPVSAVGHADTANVIGNILDHNVEMNRISLSLEEGDALLVGQYNGPRLQEGATNLPDDAVIDWYMVTIG